MADIGKLRVTLIANSGPFSKGIATAQKKAMIFGKRMRGFGSTIAGAMSSMFRRMAQVSALMGAGFVYGIAKSAQSIDNLAKSSRKLLGNNGATGALAGLRLAGKLAGEEVATLDKGMEVMLDTISNAGDGDQTAIDALSAIGLTADQLKKANPQKRLEMVADGITKVADAGDRIRMAKDIFGRGGASLLELFSGGADGIAKARREADLFGLSLSGPAAIGVEMMNDNFTRLGSVVEGVFMQTTARVAPMITDISDKTLAWIEQSGGIESIVGSAFNTIVDVGANVIDTATDIATSFGELIKSATGFEGIGGNFDALLSTIGKVNDSLELAFLNVKKVYNEFSAFRDTLLAGVFGSEDRAKQKAEDRMVAGIAPDKQEEFRKRLRESGGAEVEQVTFGVRAKAHAEEAALAGRQIEEHGKPKPDITSPTKNFIADAQRKSDIAANKAIDDRLLKEQDVTKEIEAQEKMKKGTDTGTAGQGSRLLTAFSGPTFNNQNKREGEMVNLLQRIATNTGTAQGAVLA